MGRRRRFSENEDDGGDEGVVELNVVGVEAVGANEGYAIGEVGLERGSVIHVHELGGDEPCGVAVVLHPRGGEEKEVDVETGQAVYVDAGHLGGNGLEALFVLAVGGG